MGEFGFEGPAAQTAGGFDDRRFEAGDRCIDRLARLGTFGGRQGSDRTPDGRDLAATPEKTNAQRLEGGLIFRRRKRFVQARAK